MSNHNPVGPSSTAQIKAQTKSQSLYSHEWPVSRSARIEEVSLRRRAYLSLGYLTNEIKQLGLFQALDANDNITQETSRISRDIAFVCDVDAASIASDALQVESTDASAPDVTIMAKAVWARSNIDHERLRWATNLVVDGEIGIETIIRADKKAVLITHPYENYHVTYDETGTLMLAVCIETTIMQPAIYDAQTGEELQPIREAPYRKEMTPTMTRVWIDGEYKLELSGPNLLGVIPFSRVSFRDVLDGTFSTWAGYGYGDAIATVDSFITQLRTLGTRHANPILLGIGVTVAGESQLQEAGRTVSIPENAKLEWLEASLGAVDSLLKTSVEVRQRCIETLPEFLFVDAGASSSGTALSYRAQAFVAKIEPIRQKFYAAIARQIALAVVMDRMLRDPSITWNDDLTLITVSGGPAIPQDVATLAKLYTDLWAAGALSYQDLVRHLQSMGIVRKDVTAEEYMASIQAEKQSMVAGTSTI